MAKLNADFTLKRETLSGTVEIPALLRGFNFFPLTNLPVYRLIMVLGIVPDLFYATPLYKPLGDYESFHPEKEVTQWNPTHCGSAPVTLQLSLPYLPPNEAYSLVLSVGVEFGRVLSAGRIEPVKGAGSGKILALA
jgi:hypothetical protein